jgi:HAD superfamily hydrolase (TIGR01509 family)
VSNDRGARFDLVIFDCDGVLVDSEPIANRIFTGMLAEVGLPMSEDEAMRTFIGHTLASCVAMIGERLGRPAPAGFAEDFQRRLVETFRSELRAVPGIEQVLDALDRDLAVPYCVASSGSHEKMRTSLGVTGLLPRVAGRIFSASDVERGKPFPDLFLHAARSLGADPGRCAVVEDTTLGARAGVAAGMRVFGFAAASDAAGLQALGATVFRDMAELPDLLRRA